MWQSKIPQFQQQSCNIIFNGCLYSAKLVLEMKRFRTIFKLSHRTGTLCLWWGTEAIHCHLANQGIYHARYLKGCRLLHVLWQGQQCRLRTMIQAPFWRSSNTQLWILPTTTAGHQNSWVKPVTRIVTEVRPWKKGPDARRSHRCVWPTPGGCWFGWRSQQINLFIDSFERLCQSVDNSLHSFHLTQPYNFLDFTHRLQVTWWFLLFFLCFLYTKTLKHGTHGFNLWKTGYPVPCLPGAHFDGLPEVDSRVSRASRSAYGFGEKTQRTVHRKRYILRLSFIIHSFIHACQRYGCETTWNILRKVCISIPVGVSLPDPSAEQRVQIVWN